MLILTFHDYLKVLKNTISKCAAKLNRPRLLHRVGGAFKVWEIFQLQQTKLFNYVEVIVVAYFHLIEVCCACHM